MRRATYATSVGAVHKLAFLWDQDRDEELRSEIFRKFPRTDITDYFSSYSEYDNYSISSSKKG